MSNVHTLILYTVSWVVNIAMYFFYVGVSAIIMKVFSIEGDIKIVGGILLLLTLLHNNSARIINEKVKGEN